MEEIIENTVRELRDEASVDFISLPLIAESLREDLDLQTQKDIRRHAIEVIRRLMQLGICPGDYDLAVTISFWPGSLDELLKRIEAEWIAMGRSPTLEHPICWFGLKHPEPA